MKPYSVDQREREQRRRAWLSVPTVAEQFPAVEELTIEMRFRDPDGKLTPSPQNRIFVPDMQAYFDFQCPLKDCNGGRFDLSAAVPRALSGKHPVVSGKLSCQGKRKRASADQPRCLLELEYKVTASSKRAAAA